MRAIDRAECAAFGHAPRQALRGGLAASDFALTAMIEGRPAAMLGVVTLSAVEGLGRPWLLGTDEIYRQGRALVTLGPRVIDTMLGRHRELRNLVSAGNTRAIRLMERWGFTVEAQVQAIGGLAFREFRMTRPNG